MKFQTRAQRAATNPGEPLYSVSEIADRLGIEEATLRSLLCHFPGLKYWRKGSSSSSALHHHMYRLSDARLWWATVPEKSREKAKAKMK